MDNTTKKKTVDSPKVLQLSHDQRATIELKPGGYSLVKFQLDEAMSFCLYVWTIDKTF